AADVLQYAHPPRRRVRPPAGGKGGDVRVRPHRVRGAAHRQPAHVLLFRHPAEVPGVPRLRRALRDEPDGRRRQDDPRGHAEGREAERLHAAVHRQPVPRLRAAGHPPGRHAPARHALRRRDDRHHPPAGGARAGVRVGGLRLLRHLGVRRLRQAVEGRRFRRPPRRARGRGRVRQGRRPRLRAVEVCEARGRGSGRRVGHAVGQGTARVAHRVLGHVVRGAGRNVRHPRGRRGPGLSAPRGRDRPVRGRHGQGVRALLAAWRVPAAGRREDGQVHGQHLQPGRPGGAGDPSLVHPLPVPDGPLPQQAQLHLRGAGLRGRGGAPHPRRARPHARASRRARPRRHGYPVAAHRRRRGAGGVHGGDGPGPEHQRGARGAPRAGEPRQRAPARPGDGRHQPCGARRGAAGVRAHRRRVRLHRPVRSGERGGRGPVGVGRGADRGAAGGPQGARLRPGRRHPRRDRRARHRAGGHAV
ncbi:MAG: Cysteinyl-tRNA synthetase, partial [uncultured Gemmatimonadetes bacterium]